MEKITRKEFLQILQANETCMFCDRFSTGRSDEYILNDAEVLSYLPGEWRSVVNVTSVGVQFSDGSWCRWDQTDTEYSYWKGEGMVVRLMRNDMCVYRNVYLLK